MCLPAIHFLVKNANFKLLYFSQFADLELPKTSHFFAKFGTTNLHVFMHPIFPLIWLINIRNVRLFRERAFTFSTSGTFVRYSVMQHVV